MNGETSPTLADFITLCDKFGEQPWRVLHPGPLDDDSAALKILRSIAAQVEPFR